MTTSSGVICGVCDVQHITKYAEVWCPECEEGLCSDCQKHHSFLKATGKHSTILVDQYKKIAPYVSELVPHCIKHDKTYTNYCQNHDELCCPDCISTTHVSCTCYLSVEEVIKTAKTSTLLDSMEQSLNDIQNNIEKAIHNRENNLSNIKKQKQELIENVKQLRDKINSHLDTLEHNFMEELNSTEARSQTLMGNLIECLSKERENVTELKYRITFLKEHASDIQTFIGSKMCQPEVVKAEKYIKSLSEGGSLNQLNLTCNFDENIWKQLSKITSFGNLSTEVGYPTLDIKIKKYREAQIVVPSRNKSSKPINNIKFSFLSTYNVPRPGSFGYRGCAILSNGKIILTDNSGSKLVVLNNNGTLNGTITCAVSYIYDVTNVDDKIIAAATNEGIHVISIDSKKANKIIKTNRTCYGITCNTGVLMWCEELEGLRRMNVSDGNVITLVKQDLPRNSYVTTYGDKIFQTNWTRCSVTCFTIEGVWQWEYTNRDILEYPTCVSVDKSFNIYVSSPDNNSIVVLQSDGKEGRQLLSKADNLHHPVGIYFERTENNLVIVNRKGPVLLYNIF